MTCRDTRKRPSVEITAKATNCAPIYPSFAAPPRLSKLRRSTWRKSERKQQPNPRIIIYFDAAWPSWNFCLQTSRYLSWSAQSWAASVLSGLSLLGSADHHHDHDHASGRRGGTREKSYFDANTTCKNTTKTPTRFTISRFFAVVRDLWGVGGSVQDTAPGVSQPGPNLRQKESVRSRS